MLYQRVLYNSFEDVFTSILIVYVDIRLNLLYTLENSGNSITNEEKGDLIMKKKSILSVLLAVAMVFSVTTPALAATKPATKTVTFAPYDTDDKDFTDWTATVKVTNVTKQVTKDFSVDLKAGEDTYTFAGTKSKVIYVKAPATITLQPNKGEKHAGVYAFSIIAGEDTYKSVKAKFKYYAFNLNKYEFDFSKKLSSAPDGSYGYADGSTQTLTKKGTYVLNVKPFNGVDDTEIPLTNVFIVVK
jgi:hypothetical protein